MAAGRLSTRTPFCLCVHLVHLRPGRLGDVRGSALAQGRELTMAAVKRKPIGLILVLLLFVAPFVAAWLLNASGWRPIGTRNYGELITPPENLSAARFVLADGQVLKWRDPSWTWTIFALAGPDCAASCVARID